MNGQDACQICESIRSATPLFENELWFVSQTSAGVPGWMMMQSQRHTGGPAHFTDEEAGNFGPALRHLEKTLEDVSGAERIYTAAFGEGARHFHCHMIPRYAEMPNDALAFEVFNLLEATRSGAVPYDEELAARVGAAYAAALASHPPPDPDRQSAVANEASRRAG